MWQPRTLRIKSAIAETKADPVAAAAVGRSVAERLAEAIRSGPGGVVHVTPDRRWHMQRYAISAVPYQAFDTVNRARLVGRGRGTPVVLESPEAGEALISFDPGYVNQMKQGFRLARTHLRAGLGRVSMADNDLSRRQAATGDFQELAAQYKAGEFRGVIPDGIGT